MIGYGKLYSADFGGYVNCFDLKTGALNWTFWTGTSGYETPYGVWPVVNFECIADGKIFVMGGHLYSPPLFHGGLLYCINATSGDLIWSSPSFAITNGANCAISDGYLVVPNAYDNRLYCYGKGPSATTVSVPDIVQSFGSSILIKGTVTDQSAGAIGTPAIADEDMSAWMEYLYQQQPKPTNATGVTVLLQTLDPNGNYYDIGTATSDANGMYSLLWQPPVPGKYTIIASFQGSESYWPSTSETALGVSEAPAATPGPTPPPASMTDTYVIGTGIAVIIAIGIAVVLILRKH
jgi:hypothetical protein